MRLKGWRVNDFNIAIQQNRTDVEANVEAVFPGPLSATILRYICGVDFDCF